MLALWTIIALISLPPQRQSPAFVVAPPPESHTNFIYEWQPIEGADGYEIWQCMNKWGCVPFNQFDSTNWEVIACTTSNSFTIPMTNEVYSVIVDTNGTAIGIATNHAGFFKAVPFNSLGRYYEQ